MEFISIEFISNVTSHSIYKTEKEIENNIVKIVHCFV